MEIPYPFYRSFVFRFESSSANGIKRGIVIYILKKKNDIVVNKALSIKDFSELQWFNINSVYSNKKIKRKKIVDKNINYSPDMILFRRFKSSFCIDHLQLCL